MGPTVICKNKNKVCKAISASTGLVKVLRRSGRAEGGEGVPTCKRQIASCSAGGRQADVWKMLSTCIKPNCLVAVILKRRERTARSLHQRWMLGCIHTYTSDKQLHLRCKLTTILWIIGRTDDPPPLLVAPPCADIILFSYFITVN